MVPIRIAVSGPLYSLDRNEYTRDSRRQRRVCEGDKGVEYWVEKEMRERDWRWKGEQGPSGGGEDQCAFRTHTYCFPMSRLILYDQAKARLRVSHGRRVC